MRPKRSAICKRSIVGLPTQGSDSIALDYVERVQDYCAGFEIAAERGSARNDILPGLRAVGFRRNLTIAFRVSDTQVMILRLLRAGLDWERDLSTRR